MQRTERRRRPGFMVPFLSAATELEGPLSQAPFIALTLFVHHFSGSSRRRGNWESMVAGPLTYAPSDLDDTLPPT